MLILSCSTLPDRNEILIGDDIKLTICSINRHQVRIGIDAPDHVKIMRPDAINQYKNKEVNGNR